MRKLLVAFAMLAVCTTAAAAQPCQIVHDVAEALEQGEQVVRSRQLPEARALRGEQVAAFARDAGYKIKVHGVLVYRDPETDRIRMVILFNHPDVPHAMACVGEPLEHIRPAITKHFGVTFGPRS